jgi:iron complex outermembrane receptor protein
VPFVEEGQVELTPRRHTLSVKAGADKLGGVVEGIRATLAARRYRHEEIVGGEIGTRFENDTNEAEVMLRHRPAGRLSGTIGVSFLDRAFSALGEEALSPPVDERNFAAFFYEELSWPHLTVQFGARANRASYEPGGDLRPRDFTDVSGSVGLLLRPAAADDRLIIAFSLARAVRHPALEELYFFGPHPGNFAFEIGNPDLNSERAFGFDASLRWRMPRGSGEITYFRNSIDDYIFRNPISEEEFDERFGHEAEEGHGHDEFPIIEFTASDSLLQGIEAHADVELGGEAGPRVRRGDAHRRLQPAAALRLLFLRRRKRRPHHHRPPGQRDRRALSQPPLAHQGLRARDGKEFQSRLRVAVLMARDLGLGVQRRNRRTRTIATAAAATTPAPVCQAEGVAAVREA